MDTATPEYMTTAQAMTYTGRTQRNLSQMATDGKLRRFKSAHDARRILYAKSDLDQMMEAEAEERIIHIPISA